MKNSNISWTDHTFNPWIGCSKVSAGCAHCYAETLMDTRYHRVEWGSGGTRVRTSPENWRQPVKWNSEAEARGVRYQVFCASLADVFEERGELAAWRDDLHDLIHRTPNLDWLLLTKRPEMAAWCYAEQPIPANVWLGTSVENQAAADRRIPILSAIPAAIRFLSCEPLLGEIAGIDLSAISWVIVGGESGAGCRPMAPEWAISLRDQCRVAKVPYFFKQWGGRTPKTNGNILDGQIYENFPKKRGRRPMRTTAAGSVVAHRRREKAAAIS
jgi:protein gp37